MNLKTIYRVAAYLAILFASLYSDTGDRQAHGALNARAGKRPYALTIGVSDYRHWPAVPQALSNARKLSRVLESGGFEVHALENPSAAELQAALGTLVYPVGQTPGREIAVYYCGQGTSRVSADGTFVGWIIPRDCPRPEEDAQAFEEKAVSTDSIEARARQIKSLRVIMFFDAALAGGTFAVETPALRIAASRDAQPARQYIIAGHPDEPVADHGGFTDALIQALGGQADAVPDGLLTGSELAVFIANRVVQRTHGRVNPQFGKSRSPELSRGEFFFDKIRLPGGTHLFIQTLPSDARVRILNIQPKFTQGIALPPGRYRIEVAAPGHVTQRKWINLSADRDEQIRVELEQIVPVTVNTLGMAMKWIYGTEFFMGSPDDEPGRQPDEQRHRVRLKNGFRIQTTEVSVRQFRQFTDATGYRTEAEKNGGCWTMDAGGRWRLSPATTWKTAGPWMQVSAKERDRLPVTCVSWNDANAFARWLSNQEGRTYNLPTEAQWELACRAGTRSPFAFGSCLTSVTANYASSGTYYSHCPHQPEPGHAGLKPVDGNLKNQWDLSAMHGNAAEWCLSWYAPYAQSREAADVLGTERVVRGGHFAGTADQCRSAKRSSFKPDAAANVIGFRLVQAPAP